ncbi:MAG: fasciclin domain-containing protein [Candidatus Eremiobacteraeota bacterium]|nr:fasciclin domain-containing protein [Candidatus Eremiobacteraeota bacterium]
MKNVSRLGAVALACACAIIPLTSLAQDNPMVGGHAMMANKDIISNAVLSEDNKTLVAAVKAADLVATLQGPGPFTVFAPTDEAFAALPAGMVDTVMKPENKKMLAGVLAYHVVAGRLDYAALQALITAGNGKAVLKTVNGANLTAAMNGPRNITVTDDKGNVAHISTYDVYQSNGVIHIIDRVLMP